MELDHKLIKSAEDGDLVFALNADSRLRKRQQQRTKQQDRQIFQTVLNDKNVELQRSVIFKANMSNIFKFQLLTCKDLWFFLVIYNSK